MIWVFIVFVGIKIVVSFWHSRWPLFLKKEKNGSDIRGIKLLKEVEIKEFFLKNFSPFVWHSTPSSDLPLLEF